MMFGSLKEVRDSLEANYDSLQAEVEANAAILYKADVSKAIAYLNHYSSPSKNWNIGVTLGWQIFGSKFIE